MEAIHKRILGGLAAVLLVLVLAVVAVLVIKGPAGGDGFTPPPFDPASESGDPSSQIPKEMMYTPLELREDYVVSLCGSPVLEHNGKETSVTLYFTAAQNNSVWVRLLVLTEDGRELGSTGLLKPGTYVKSVSLTEDPGAGAKLTLKVLSYQPETYYSEGSASAVVTVRDDQA